MDQFIVRHPYEDFLYFVFYKLEEFNQEFKDLLTKENRPYKIEKHTSTTTIEEIKCQI